MVDLQESIAARTTISVSGAQSGVGKTALAQILLRNLSNFAAIKVTITDHTCMVIDDECELMIPDKDTWRMRKSGAAQVVWVKSNESGLYESLRTALSNIVPGRGILIEGNSVLRHLAPTIAFFVVKHPCSTMKESRMQALAKADVCVINQIGPASGEKEIVDSIHAYNAALTVLSLNLLDPAASRGDDYARLIALLNERIS